MRTRTRLITGAFSNGENLQSKLSHVIAANHKRPIHAENVASATKKLNLILISLDTRGSIIMHTHKD